MVSIYLCLSIGNVVSILQVVHHSFCFASAIWPEITEDAYHRSTVAHGRNTRYEATKSPFRAFGVLIGERACSWDRDGCSRCNREPPLTLLVVAPFLRERRAIRGAAASSPWIPTAATAWAVTQCMWYLQVGPQVWRWDDPALVLQEHVVDRLWRQLVDLEDSG